MATDLKTPRDALNNFSKAVKTSADTLEKVEDMTKVAGNLCKLSAGLGGMAGAIGFLGEMTGLIKSQHKETLEAIEKISDQIKELSRDIGEKFEEQSKADNERDAWAIVEENKNIIKTANANLNAYCSSKLRLLPSNEKNGAWDLLTNKTDINGLDIAAENLADATNKDGANILEAFFDRSFGKVFEVQSMGNAILHRIVSAYITSMTITKLNGKKNNPGANENIINNNIEDVVDKTNETYIKLLNDVNNNVKYWVDKCGELATVKSLIPKAEALYVKGYTNCTYAEYGNEMRNKLKVHWPQMDWLILTYDCNLGNDHSWTRTNSHFIVNINNRNVVIAWTPKSDRSAIKYSTDIRTAAGIIKAENIDWIHKALMMYLPRSDKYALTSNFVWMTNPGVALDMRSTNPARYVFYQGSRRNLILFGKYNSMDYYGFNNSKNKVESNFPRLFLWPGLERFSPGFDAAYKDDNGKAYFFKENLYIQFDINSSKADTGYPRTIESKWPGMPFSGSMQAAVNVGNGVVWFINGDLICQYNTKTDKVVGMKNWPTLPGMQNFKSISKDAYITAALNIGNGKIYLFVGYNYVRMNPNTLVVDAGFPKNTKDYWPGLPSRWIRAAIDLGKGSSYFFPY